MSEWTVEIESGARLATSAKELERFADALDAQLGATGASTSANVQTGVVSATFTVAAATAVRATDLAVSTFLDALRAGGLAPGDPARVAVERVPRGDAVPA